MNPDLTVISQVCMFVFVRHGVCCVLCLTNVELMSKQKVSVACATHCRQADIAWKQLLAIK